MPAVRERGPAGLLVERSGALSSEGGEAAEAARVLAVAGGWLGSGSELCLSLLWWRMLHRRFNE